ncbi:MAG: nucleotidyltransferase domain-containing protein [Bdellovibrionales bacterium]|nr:nucleotidyltransferase domain-containing protein [Bdellovibrionales bacterium]
MAPQVLDPKLKVLIDALKPLGVRRISIFGSFARGEPNPGDIDVLILFEPGAKKKVGLNWFSLAESISKLIGTRVDLITEESIAPSLKRYIEKDVKVIYEKTG